MKTSEHFKKEQAVFKAAGEHFDSMEKICRDQGREEEADHNASLAKLFGDHAQHCAKCAAEGMTRKADYGADFAKAHEDQLEPRAASVFPVPRFGAPNFTAPSPSNTWQPPVFKFEQPAGPVVDPFFQDLVKVDEGSETDLP